MTLTLIIIGDHHLKTVVQISKDNSLQEIYFFVYATYDNITNIYKETVK